MRLSSVRARAPAAPDWAEPCRQKFDAVWQRHRASKPGVCVWRMVALPPPFPVRGRSQRTSDAPAAARPSPAPTLPSRSSNTAYHGLDTRSKFGFGVSAARRKGRTRRIRRTRVRWRCGWWRRSGDADKNCDEIQCEKRLTICPTILMYERLVCILIG